MKKTFLLIAIAIVSVAAISCDSTEKKNTDDTHQISGEVYTCPMHPEVISDKPSSCPKCGMDLVKKAESEHMDMKHDSTMHSDSTMKM